MDKQALRPMSIHEASFPVFADMAPGAGNIVAALELTGDFNIEDVKSACAYMDKKHPLFSAGYKDINDGQGKPEFWFYRYVDTDINIDWQSVSGSDYPIKVQQVREKYLNYHFLHAERLCCLAVVQNLDTQGAQRQSTVFFCISHAVCDGSGTYHLMHDWLLLMDAIIAKQTPELSPMPLAPALWASMPKAISGFLGAFRSLGVLFTMINAQKQADKGFSFGIEKPAPAPEHRCIVTHAVLAQEQFNALRAVAKAKGASLHGLIASALIYALMDYLKKQPALLSWVTQQETIDYPMVTTVNVRDKVSPPLDPHSISCQSSGVSTDVRLKTDYLTQSEDAFEYDDYWSIARQIADEVPRVLKENQHWKILRIYQIAGLNGLKKMFADSAEKPLSTPLSLANLNRVDFSGTTHLKVTDAEMQAAFHALGSGMNITVSSFDNRLKLCITCAYPLSSKQTLREFAQNVEKHLTQIAKG